MRLVNVSGWHDAHEARKQKIKGNEQEKEKGMNSSYKLTRCKQEDMVTLQYIAGCVRQRACLPMSAICFLEKWRCTDKSLETSVAAK